jgi:hypothetical protein
MLRTPKNVFALSGGDWSFACSDATLMVTGRMRSKVATVTVSLAILSAAYSFAAFADSPANRASVDTGAKCSSLEGITIPAAQIDLPTGGAVVTQATLVPAGSPNPYGEYCLIYGEVAPIDPQAQKIKFTVAMPSHWNGKMLQVGPGGYNGSILSPRALEAPIFVAPPAPLARGYVTFGSDSGHADASGIDPSFALNGEQLRNFAGDQLKKTHDAVMYLLKMRYHAAPVHSYFVGGSEGGREALTVIQQYSKDYDGVLVIFPALRFTASMLKFLLISRDMQLNNGAGLISRAKAETLRKAELAACDKLDGLEDSIISNVNTCAIDFDQLRCPTGKEAQVDCFSDAQVKTLKDAYLPVQLPYMLNGSRTLPAYMIGADWAPAAFGDITYFRFADTFVRYFLLRDPKAADTLAFDPQNPGNILPRIQEIANLLDRTSTDLDTFIARGGKAILLGGESDGAVSPLAITDYYHSLVAKYGQVQTDNFLRLYMVPGYAHGGGLSFNANGGPSFDALEDWVERGLSPTTLTVVDANPEAHGRSRPMCVYPAWPKYNGVGDPNLASSFSCVRK